MYTQAMHDASSDPVAGTEHLGRPCFQDEYLALQLDDADICPLTEAAILVAIYARSIEATKQYKARTFHLPVHRGISVQPVACIKYGLTCNGVRPGCTDQR
jgi:hypothetical protein